MPGLLLTLTLFAAALALLGAGRAAPREGSAPGDRPRERLERALAALGGRERLAAAPAWHVEGRGREDLSAELQGRSPGLPTWRPHRERLAVDTRSFTVAWERRTPRND